MLELTVAPGNRSSYFRGTRERERPDNTRNLVFLWTFDGKQACAFGQCIWFVMKGFPLLAFVWMGEAGDGWCKICSVVVWEQSICTFLILQCSFERVNRQLMCCVLSKVWYVWSRPGEHGRLGSLKAVSVLCVFGPSLFGYIMF